LGLCFPPPSGRGGSGASVEKALMRKFFILALKTAYF
jgi:hypothetical protein